DLLGRYGSDSRYDPPVGLVEILTGFPRPWSVAIHKRLLGQKKVCNSIQRYRASNASERRNAMALKQGEVYRCPDPECGCEVTVTRGAAPREGRRSESSVLLRQGD